MRGNVRVVLDAPFAARELVCHAFLHRKQRHGADGEDGQLRYRTKFLSAQAAATSRWDGEAETNLVVCEVQADDRAIVAQRVVTDAELWGSSASQSESIRNTWSKYDTELWGGKLCGVRRVLLPSNEPSYSAQRYLLACRGGR